MLYLVSTPIGNLADITFRAVDILRACDYILCEDTRHSQPLLDRYEIRKPLRSYHQFNEAEREEEVVEDLKKELQIALISDAGTPGISDPGQRLVGRCRKEGLPITVAPGACAAIAALTLSGLKTDRFQFVGFLPRQLSELKKSLHDLIHYSGTSICYESPHRLADTLTVLASFPKPVKLKVARELTKIYEECLEGSAQELLAHFQAHPPKGEIVLLLEGGADDESLLTPQEHVRSLQEEYGLSLKEAIKAAAALRNTSKKIIYDSVHKN